MSVKTPVFQYLHEELSSALRSKVLCQKEFNLDTLLSPSKVITICGSQDTTKRRL